MKNSFQNGQTDRPSNVIRKVEALARFDAREEFDSDMRGICPRNQRVKFASFARASRALADLGLSDEMESDKVEWAFVYRSTFRDEYIEVAARHAGISCC
jgi:hypothetical protein